MIEGSVEGVVWLGILDSIKSKLSPESYQTWFQRLRFDGLDRAERVIRLCAPNNQVRDWISSNYSSLVDESLNERSLHGYLIGWTVEEAADQPAATVEFAAAASAAAAGALRSARDSQRFDPASQPSPASARHLPEPTLNPKYTYGTFVVGSCNQFAHAASLAVAEAPGKTYNPLYIYGGVGLGKTHLMHACGQAIKNRNPGLRLCYL